jgi:hypothetical protein
MATALTALDVDGLRSYPASRSLLIAGLNHEARTMIETTPNQRFYSHDSFMMHHFLAVVVSCHICRWLEISWWASCVPMTREHFDWPQHARLSAAPSAPEAPTEWPNCTHHFHSLFSSTLAGSEDVGVTKPRLTTASTGFWKRVGL